MSDQPIDPTREDLAAVLVAYLDGELDETDVREVEDLLEHYESARALLEQLEASAATLPKVYQSVLQEPVPEHLVAAIEGTPGGGIDASGVEASGVEASGADARGANGGGADAGPAGREAAPTEIPVGIRGPAGAEVHQLPARPARRSVLTRMAASIALLVAGGGGGYLARDYLPYDPPFELPFDKRPPVKPGWLDQVAQYHSVYAKESRHLVEVGADEIEHIKAWLGKRLGRETLVADLSGEGMVFQGARLLVINGAPVAQLMYLPPDGRPLGFCIIKSPKDDAPFKAQQKADLNLVSWRRGGYGFVVIGWTPPDALLAVAETAAAQMGDV